MSRLFFALICSFFISQALSSICADGSCSTVMVKASKSDSMYCEEESCSSDSNSASSISSYRLPALTRKWRPPEPAAPGETRPSYRRHLNLHVMVRFPVDDQSDAVERFFQSARIQNIMTLGVPDHLQYGTPVFNDVLTAELSEISGDNDVILYLDSIDETLMLGESIEILRRFEDVLSTQESGKIVFASQKRCQSRCAFDWPTVNEEVGEQRYMNPSSFIGFASAVKEMFDVMPSPDPRFPLTSHDVFLNFFLDTSMRRDLGLVLDTKSEIFQSLHGFDDELGALDYVFSIEETFKGQPDPRLKNILTGSFPSVVSAGGNTKLLQQFSNYMPMRRVDGQCIACMESLVELPSPTPIVVLSFEVVADSPFLETVLDSLEHLDYPSEALHVVIGVHAGKSSTRYRQIITQWKSHLTDSFASVELQDGDVRPVDSRRFALQQSTALNADYIFMLDSTTWLNNSTVLNHLVKLQRNAVAPFLNRENAYFSNFWGQTKGDFDSQCYDNNKNCGAWAIADECEKNEKWMKSHCRRSCKACEPPSLDVDDLDYARSFDYFDIASRKISGLFDVPFVSTGMLVKKDIFNLVDLALDASEEQDHATHHWVINAMMSSIFRRNKMFLGIDNQFQWGHLINNMNYNHDYLYPDLFLFEGNEQIWAARYLHPEYNASRNLEFVQGRCWDIYNFPLFNEDFCWRFINESEHFGEWSGGKNQDKRLQGGYEPVPTRDIHFYQFGFQKTWIALVRHFVAPIAEKTWVGYGYEGKKSLDFIVKYEPHGQPSLRPHHDASTFSLNVALNRIGVDFQGGGTRFIRQNCTVLSNQQGWALFHPGRLTHQHEGLHVTEGRRYIIVSFVDQ